MEEGGGAAALARAVAATGEPLVATLSLPRSAASGVQEPLVGQSGRGPAGLLQAPRQGRPVNTLLTAELQLWACQRGPQRC